MFARFNKSLVFLSKYKERVYWYIENINVLKYKLHFFCFAFILNVHCGFFPLFKGL